MKDDGPTSTGALDGLRVVDLSRVLAGPLCAQMLGDHGATVVKVEAPAGDDTRTYGPFVDTDKSGYYDAINRNKLHVSLDLSTELGRHRLLALVDAADVVIENFRLGTMAKWGLDQDTVLSARNRRLIYCRITGYGDDGPLGGLPGYDAALQAYGGLMSINGDPDGEPVRLGVPLVDMVTGIHAFGAICLAVVERERSGLGQVVSSSLIDSSVMLLHPHTAHWFATGEDPVRTGSAHPSIAPYEVFRVGDRRLFIAAANDTQFALLCQVLGVDELARDARFSRNRDRVKNVAELRPLLVSAMTRWEPDLLCEELLRVGLTASPLNSVSQAMNSAQVRHRGLVLQDHGYSGVASPMRLSRTPATLRTPPSSVGADNDLVFGSSAAAVGGEGAGVTVDWESLTSHHSRKEASL